MIDDMGSPDEASGSTTGEAGALDDVNDTEEQAIARGSAVKSARRRAGRLATRGDAILQ
jgi:hypothetical protein